MAVSFIQTKWPTKKPLKIHDLEELQAGKEITHLEDLRYLM